MGASYITSPVNDEAKTWLLELGVSAPKLCGRAATPREISAAINRLEECGAEDNLTDGGDAFVWELFRKDVVWTTVQIWKYFGPDEPCDFSFRGGHTDMILRIMNEVAKLCGPFIVVASSSASPAVLEPGCDLDAVSRNWTP